MSLARRLAVVGLVLAAMLGTVLAGVASARPTGTLPRPTTNGTASPSDLVTGIGETIVQVTPIGRAGSIARNLFRLVNGVATVSQFLDYFDEDGTATGAPEGVEPFQPNGGPSGAYAVLSMNTVTRSPDGLGFVMTLNYSPNAELQATNYYGAVCLPNSQAGCYFGADGNVATANVNATSQCADTSEGNVVYSQTNLVYLSSGGVSRGACREGDTVLSMAWAGGFSAGGLMLPGSFSLDGPAVLPWVTETRVTCTIMATGASTVVVGTSSERGTAQVPPCTGGSQPTGVEVWSGPPGLLQQRDAVTIDQDVTRGTYPECIGGCRLTVSIDGVPCTVGAAACYNWQAIGSDRLSCSWGPYSVSLGSCTDLAYAYRTGQTTYNPDTKTWVAANPQGQPDPNHAPNVVTQPNPNPNPDPTPEPDPDNPFGPQPAPSNCWAGMISWNPLDWVYTPVKCALQWAFVPSPGAWAAQVSARSDTLRDTGVGSWLYAIGDSLDVLSSPGAGSCRGPAISFPVMGDTLTFYPLSYCENPAAMLRTVVYGMAVFTLAFGSMIVGIRLLGASFGLNVGWLGAYDRSTSVATKALT